MKCLVLTCPAHAPESVLAVGLLCLELKYRLNSFKGFKKIAFPFSEFDFSTYIIYILQLMKKLYFRCQASAS